MLALATDTFGTLLWPHPGGETGLPPSLPGVLRSVMPALDLAFGLSDLSDMPDDLAALVARLQAGPLGGRAGAPSRVGPADAPRIPENSHG
ncbi:hypothetical protein [Methylobacterium sp.]|jgi:hypothetical protein|uniref:hypothetical protein n=1 Tax=Methylobacterium sp. TaxID=409 RepID=UPI0026125F36|nr:hypothetical protein [Methylobacterium sp.]MDB5648304.1 hypothetical protein [Methylobacterium sp.]